MRRLAALLGALALGGCALLGRGEPLVPRYFTPALDGEAAAAPAPPGLRLRLGRVEGWAHLRERMATRDAGGELSYAEDRRWTERPEVYLRRALARALFEDRGLVEVVSGRAVTLEVELTAFEEILAPHLVRLQARVALRDDRAGLLEESITVEQPVAVSPGADPMRPLVEAYSLALRSGVSRIAEQVVAGLSRAPAPAPP